MSAHGAPELITVQADPPVRPSVSPALLVILSVIASLTLVAVALVWKGAAEQASSMIIVALMLGTGLAVGFRKRWSK